MLRGPYKRKYDQNTLEKALHRIKKGEISIRKASATYNIPKTTLIDRTQGRIEIRATPGARTVLTNDEENAIVDWLKEMAKIGYGQSRSQLQLVIKKILDDDGRKTPFLNNIPGRDWFRRFSNRHPEISERIAEPLGKERAVLTCGKIDGWFQGLEDYLQEEKCEDILLDGSRIYNCDESGFPLSGNAIKVMAERGSRNAYQLTNSDKHQITILACMGAAGTFIPPMLIYPGQRFKFNPLSNAPTEWCIGRSENGWIDQEVFYEWVANHFLPFLKTKECQFPVLLLVDGHRSHINLETAKFCSENQIILYCFPAHASHVLQPCDLSLFGSLKRKWKVVRREWQQENPGQNVTKQNFAEVFSRTWAHSSERAEIAQNGFRASGIFPFTKNYDRSKLDASKVFVGPTEVTSSESVPDQLSTSPTPPIPPPPPAATATTTGEDAQILTALRIIEETFTDEKMWLFNKRFEEGFDLKTDELYNTWRKINERVPTKAVDAGPSTTPTPTTTSTLSPQLTRPSTSSGSIISTNPPALSPPLAAHLTFPKAVQNTTQNRRRAEQLPKAISGKAYITMMEKKRKEKEEDEKRKEKNRKEREEKRLQKLKGKSGKKAGKKDACVTSNDCSESSSEEEHNDESNETIDENRCSRCGRRYIGDDQNWIGCEGCPRWYHKKCTDLMNAQNLSSSELNKISWFCDHCL